MSNRLSAVMGLLVLAWTGSAWALGLGEIEAKSHLNQPLVAQIAISSSTPAELDSLVVALASNEDFERAGLERPEFLSTLQFEVQGTTIRVRSKEIVRSPFVTFLLDLRWKGGRLLREYTMLLDPPTLAQAAAAPASPAAAAAAGPSKSPAKPAATASTPAAVLPPPSPAAPNTSVAPARTPPAAPVGSGSDTYGPVAAKETLWSIAYQLRPDPDAITMDQMQVALLNANPEAFTDGELTGLMKGVTLRVPSRSEIIAVDPVSAKAQVARARSSASAPAKAAPVAKAPPAPVAKPEPKPAPVVEPKPQAKPEPAVAPKSEPKPAPVVEAKAEPKPEPKPTPAPKTETKSAPASSVEPPPAATAPESQASAQPAPAAAAPESVAVQDAQSPTGTAAEGMAEGDGQAPTDTGTTVADAPAAEAETITTAPNPAAAPVLKKPKYEIQWTGFLDRGKEILGPFAIPAAAVFVILAAVLLGFRRLKDKYAQWSYNRASRKQVRQTAPKVSESEPDEPAAEGESSEGDATAVHPALGETQAMQSQSFGETQNMDAQMAATMKQSAAKPAAKPSPDQTLKQDAAPAARGVDFDVTGQYASETVQINLDAGDPVSEAEFHRAYGLYDEAALLLKQALQKDPKRSEARVKLAEIYFEASKPAEFIEVAKELKAGLPDDEWQKIALMGSQIAPDEDLFSGASVGGGTVDLSFDEPSAPAAAPAAPAPAPKAAAPKAAAPPAAESEMLDFKLDDAMEAAPKEAAAPPAVEADASADSLEFDLGGLSLDEPAAEKPAEAAAAPAEEFKMDSLDLGDFDLGEAEAEAPSTGDDGGSGDDASTKLDLARAYVDMGDNDMAKGLLNEVMSQGNEQQKKEAGELLQRVQA